jgi:hypothetical protein
MFRITCADEAETRTLRIEGWLGAEHLPLLEQGVREAEGRKLVLDLAALRGLDAAAAARIAALRAGGASLAACSPFVARLLALRRG